MWGGARRLPATRRSHGAWQALVSMLLISTGAHASVNERAPETFAVSIDRQPLDGALQQLAGQCGVQVIFFSRVTEGLTAPATRGDYTLPAAMDRLLAGSELTFRVINPQTVEVRPRQAKAASRSGENLGASKAPEASKEAAQAGPVEEVVVVGLAEQLVATRIATPLREIPQTISIVTGEQMRQRSDFTLADVLEHSPGITTIRTSSLDQGFYARAYEITSFHIDGGAAVNPKSDRNTVSPTLFVGTPDLIEFDHVEILRGADGLFAGNGDPGGTISLVRKRPQRNFALAFDVAAGSWENQRLGVDITGPIARQGALRGRAAAVYARQGYFYDLDPHERKKVFAALEYDLTPAATLTAGASYQWDYAPGVANGLPFYSDGRDSRLPRDMGFEFDWARYRSELTGSYLQYRQQFGPEWAMRLNASRWRTRAAFALGDFNALIDPVTNALNDEPDATLSAGPNLHTQDTADVTVTGALDWFGRREEVAIGADFTRLDVRSDNEGYLFGFGKRLGDPRAFDPRDYPDPRLTAAPDFGVGTISNGRRWGVFASSRIYFADSWSIVGGARLSGDRTDIEFTLLNGSRQVVVTSKRGTNHVVTPYAGVMYTFDRHYSLYASYSDIYRAQQTPVDRTPGHLLEPVRGVNIEAGIKGEWRNGALNGSVALYRTRQSNFPVFTSPGLPDVNLPFHPCCFTGVSNRSRGVEAELSGEVTPAWNIGAGYAYNLNEFPLSHPLDTVTPKHLLKAWTDIRLPGAFSRWQIGGNLHAQSETMTLPIDYCRRGSGVCVAVKGVQPAYAVFDVRAGFDVDRHWRAAVMVNNVLDKVYYESIQLPILRGWYGEPRNWMLRIDGRY